jgi:hypothetical protein
MPKPLPWSHSSLTSFVNCPKQYYEVKVIKRVKDVEGEAAQWGNRVHEAFELYLRDGVALDEELEQYRGYLDAIKSVRGELFVEQELALNTKLQPCDFYSSDTWVRGICDVLHIQEHRALAMDHKTGKRKADSRQMKLMALLIFAHYPQVEEVKVGFFWLKTHEKDTDKFVRAQIPQLWLEFMPDLQQFRVAFENDVWQPRQSGLCYGWCPVTTCEFWKPKSTNRKGR